VARWSELDSLRRLAGRGKRMDKRLGKNWHAEG